MPREKSTRGCGLPALVGLLLLLLVGVGAFSVWMVERTLLAPYESRIYPNVFVLGENLGGFTVDEASQRLDAVFATRETGDLILSDGDEAWRVPWSEAGMQLDPVATAEQAFAAGREQGWQTLLSLWVGEQGMGTSQEVSPVFTIDEDAARQAVETLAPELYDPPIDAELWLDGDEVITTPSKPGRALAIDATTENIVNTVRHLGPDYPFAPTYHTVPPTLTDVGDVKAEVEEMLGREIRIAAQGEHEGEVFTWHWTLGREIIAGWLAVDRIEENPGYAVRVDETAVAATVERLASEPQGDDWGFPTAEVTEETLQVFEAGGGEVTIALTPPPRIYVVQPGDHLTTIAAQFGMPPGLIAELNTGIDLNRLQIGQELIVPRQEALTPYETVPGKRIEISIAEQRLRVFENEQLVHDWPCSTGMKDSPTYTGHFQVVSKEEMAYASQWELEMPHFIGVYRAGGDTYNGIHALPLNAAGQRLWWRLGSPGSYGCIVLGIEEAETLFNWAELGVRVIIK